MGGYAYSMSICYEKGQLTIQTVLSGLAVIKNMLYLQDAYKSMSRGFSVASGNRYFQKKSLGNCHLINIPTLLLYYTIASEYVCVRTYKTI